jgi:ribonuclease P protein component
MQRIRTRTQFQAVMAGAIVAKTPHFALHRLALPGPEHGRLLFPVSDTWVGVVLPKRWAKRAVTRNAIRRQVYEVSRLAAGQLPPAALVVRLRSGYSREQFVSATSDALKRVVRAELTQLLGRILVRPVVEVAP